VTINIVNTTIGTVNVDSTNLSFSHNATGSDLLVVRAAIKNSIANSMCGVIRAYFNSVPMTLHVCTNRNNYSAVIFYLKNPSQGNYTVSISWPGYLGWGAAVAQCYAGADISGVPLETGFSNNNFNTTPSLTVTNSDTQDLVVDVFCSSPCGATPTVGSGQTASYAALMKYTGFEVYMGAGMSREAGAPSSVVMSWTLSSSAHWALVAASIKNGIVDIYPSTLSSGKGAINSPTIFHTVYPNTARGLGAVQEERLDYIAEIPNQRMELNTPGVADYKVILKNQSGSVVAEFDNWRSLAIARRVNTFGSCRFEIDGFDSRVSLFELDSQIEVWRRNQNVDLDWYKEWEGLHRTSNDLVQVNGKRSFVSFAVGYLHLLKRRSILWYSESAQASKSKNAGTAITEYVYENAGAGARESLGRLTNGNMTGLSLAADQGYGEEWNGAKAWDNLFTAIQSIAEDKGLYIDVVGIGNAMFEFRVYDGQRGFDLSSQNIDMTTGLNGAGNVPVIFSTDFGNMEKPNYAVNRANEINKGIALGQGVEEDRAFEIYEEVSRTLDSPWNIMEETVSASNQGNSSERLLDTARSLVEKNLYDDTFAFGIIQNKQSYYGKHYNYGDKVTLRYFDLETHKQISGVKITVSQNAVGEKMTLDFEDKLYG